MPNSKKNQAIDRKALELLYTGLKGLDAEDKSSRVPLVRSGLWPEFREL